MQSLMSFHPLRTLILTLLVGSLFALWLPNAAVQAQNGDIAFDYAFDLGEDATQAFLQDNDGFLWFGSAGGGLFRYDGYQLKHYGIGEDRLPNGNVSRIIADRENPDILWLVTLTGGFTRFDKSDETFSTYVRDPKNPKGLAAESVSDVVQDGQDASSLWIVGSGLLQRFDKHSEIFSANVFASDHPVRPEYPEFYKILQDPGDPDILWLAGYGLAKFQKSAQKITLYRHNPQDANSLGFESNFIGAIEQDKDDPNTLWLGYWDGPMLDKFDKTTESFTHYAHDPNNPTSLRDKSVQLIYDDGDGKLWLGGWADGNGLTAFDKQTAALTTYLRKDGEPRSLSSDMIVNVARDRSGILWIIHDSGKVDKYDPYTQSMTLVRKNPLTTNSLVDDALSSMYEDRDGLIWIGTKGGLSKFERTTGTFTNYTQNEENPESLVSDYILDTYQDSAGDFWIGAYGSPLLRLDRDTGRVLERIALPEGGSIAKIIEDPQDSNILWLGGVYLGFARFDKRLRALKYYPPNPQAIEQGVSESDMTQVLHDRTEPVIWLASRNGGGLNKFDKTTETFTFYLSEPSNPHSLSSNEIGDLYQDESGIIWIGTRGGGLNAFDASTEQFTRYGEAHGIPTVVNGIVADNRGKLWLSTNQGILRFNPLTATVEKRFTQDDGLQGETFSTGCRLKTQDGTLWFGGTNGLNRFNPQQIGENPYVPPIVLTALTQGGEAVKWGDGEVSERIKEITLNWKNNFFEFEYAALNYSIPEKNRYKYMLDGLDKGWYDAGTQRTGRYSGIPAGEYTLNIIGSNNDGVWNEEGISLAVTVVPPFWQTARFKFLVIALIVGGAFGTYHIRMRRITMQKKILEIQVRERTEELYQAKKRAEEAMYETERRFRVIFNQTFQFIGLANPDGAVRELNHTSIEFFQTDEAQITGTSLWNIPWFDLPEDQERIKDAIRKAAEGEFVRLETSAVAPDGSRLILDFSIKPLWGEFNNIYLLILEGRDLTDYRRTQEALLETTKANERFESELRIAHDIQMEIIPRTFPPFPDRPEFDIYAVLEPAKEVGGDLYDFFFIDEEHLCFVIGDVSDKGVPAALFMSAAKTLIKAIATQMFSYQRDGEYHEPRMDKVLDTVNYELSIENDACMFVTVFCGILNTRTGEVCYTNGGHNAPLLLRPGQAPVFIEGNHCSIIGADEDETFSQATLHIEPGDTILMYTDGVTEAMNPKREMFEEERLQTEVAGYENESVETLVKKLVDCVHCFAGEMPQNDDITVLALTYRKEGAAHKNYEYVDYIE